MRQPIHTQIEFERILRRWLPYFLIGVFVATVLGAIQGYSFHNAFRMGDWLINYQGGMIRRGLAGELVYQLSQLTGINPGVYVVSLQLIFYALFFYFSYLLVKAQTNIVPLVLLIFSPYIFTFQLNDLQGGYRKEVIYFAVLAWNAWSAMTHDKKRYSLVFGTTMLLYPLVILSHEMLAIFLPYLLLLYIRRMGSGPGSLVKLGMWLLPSVIAFIAALQFVGTPQYRADIVNSLVEQGYEIKGGALGYIGKGAAFALEKVKSDVDMVSVFGLLPTLALALAAFWPVRMNLGALFTRRLTLLLVGVSVLGSMLLFVVAVDWGRFIYINLVSIFLLMLSCRDQTVSLAADKYNVPVVSSRWILGVLIMYFTVWHIGHMMDTFSIFEVVNPINSLFLIIFLLRYRLVSS